MELFLLRLARYPLVTIGVIFICLGVFFSLMTEPYFDLSTLQAYWILPAQRIWSGDYWGLLGPAFFHYMEFHLLFNLLAFWALGSRIERVLGMGLMGLGGLISSIGGLLFLIIVLRALTRRGVQPAPQETESGQ